MVYVIGSGLSAMAAVVALVNRGIRPVILDAGLIPDAESMSAKARLAAMPPESWRSADLAPLKHTGPVAANGIPRKLLFGSDITFRGVEGEVPLDLRYASVYRTFAAGGFSNIWGAVIQPLSEGVTRGWPVTSAELARHYDAVRSLLCDESGHGKSDHPSEGRTTAPTLTPSSQAKAFYADLATARNELERQGIRFDYAPLAVRATGPNNGEGCRYCGLCLYGCPYDCRYSATTTLSRFIREGNVAYIPGVVVDRLVRTNGIIRIEAHSADGGTSRLFQARRVFLAAGLLETSRIILTTLGCYDTPQEVSHSDIFTLPVMRYRGSSSIFKEKLHTLCQLVAQIEDEAISSHPVHLQFYGYNDLYPDLLSRRAGWLSPLLMPALRAAAARLFVVFGYLHSSVSSSIKLTLCGNGKPVLRVEGRSNPMAVRISHAVALKLSRNWRLMRALPICSQLKIDVPGGGYHSGGIFPMHDAPAALQTDRLGTLPGLPGVHIIDASILPAVPAGTTAFTVMANAHRIASECRVCDGS